MKFTDVMLDLETMGRKSNSAIVSIGAVEFNIETGETGREFYAVIDLNSCLDFGLKVQADTIYFWLQQNQAARDAICCDDKHSLIAALFLLNDWVEKCIPKVMIWGNGAKFDIGILEDAYDACDLEVPWYFRSERDVRTLVGFDESIKATMPFEGIYHHPIDDCKHQIKYCSATWKKLSNNI